MVEKSALKASLLKIFLQAKSSPMTEEAYAEAMAEAITNQILSAEIPSGKVIVEVTGQAAGTANPEPIKVR